MLSNFATKLFKSFGYIFIGTIFVNIVTMINSIIIARLFDDPTLLGKLFIIQNVQAFIVTFVLFSIPTALVPLISKYKKTDKNKIIKSINSSITLITLLVIIGSLSYAILSDIVAIRIYGDQSLSLLFKINSLNVIFLSFTTFGSALLQSYHKMKHIALLNSINVIVLLILLVPLIVKWGLFGAVIAYSASSFISLLYVIHITKEILNHENIAISLSISSKELTDIIKFSFPIFLSTFAVNPAKLFVASYLSIATNFSQVGYFKIGKNLQNLFLNIPAALGVPLLPMISELNTTNPEKIPGVLTRLIKLNILITLPFIIAAGMSIKYIISMFYGPTYQEAWLFSYLAISSLLFVSLSPITMNIFLGMNKPWIILTLDFLNVGTYMISSYFLINMYGLIGTGLADIISNIVLVVVKVYYLGQNFGLKSKEIARLYTFASFSIIFAYILITIHEGILLVIEAFFLVIIIIIVEYFVLTDTEKKFVKTQIKYLSNRLRMFV
jgi:O-antigen/teichoic acid export membrane protein